MHTVVFDPTDDVSTILSHAEHQKTMLTFRNSTNCVDNKISLPEFMKIPDQNLNSLINAIFPDISKIGIYAEHINQEILNMFPEDQHTYFSADEAVIEEGADYNTIYPTEFLNTLKPNGMPPLKLNLKIGCPIILLRNIAPGEGLCNRQSVKYVGPNLQKSVFTHGQLYVALMRSTSLCSIKVLFPQENIDTTTTNIVYPGALMSNTHEHNQL
ncbi:7517_t:CDS:2 [Dentiscutata heterogama]|uniref:7517_t:CDS:1 n=1 Tax=Dentiscutata heterogama TaxID=1316150 RepID=A0ACA9MRG6_9GLOM|nr:7517_t:CDS:2 [Dentiscutata heterogama]